MNRYSAIFLIIYVFDSLLQAIIICHKIQISATIIFYTNIRKFWFGEFILDKILFCCSYLMFMWCADKKKDMCLHSYVEQHKVSLVDPLMFTLTKRDSVNVWKDVSSNTEVIWKIIFQRFCFQNFGFVPFFLIVMRPQKAWMFCNCKNIFWFFIIT